MSLPTLAKVYKNGKIVAVAHCNAGWWIESAGLYRCIKDSLYTVSDYFTNKLSERTLNDYKERYADCFGTIEDILPFDYIRIYEFDFPFELAMKVFFNKITVEEFRDICIAEGITKGAKNEI